MFREIDLSCMKDGSSAEEAKTIACRSFGEGWQHGEGEGWERAREPGEQAGERAGGLAGRRPGLR